MIIHVVKPDENIFSIAQKYNVSATRLIQENGLSNSDTLAVGQTIVITYPTQTYIVKPGDTLQSIAASFQISLMQLIRNNNYLSNRNYIYPGEVLVISYDNNKGTIDTSGYVNAFIDKEILDKSLPYLTYISIFGYRITNNAEIIDIDDSVIIKKAKEYGVEPIMLLSTFTLQGLSDIESLFNILLSENLSDKHIINIINILSTKGYYGLNIAFQFLNINTLTIHENFAQKLYSRLHENGFKLFISLPTFEFTEANSDKKVDYAKLSQYCDGFTFMNYSWSTNYGPPSPVTSIQVISDFLKFAITEISPSKIDIGCPIIGYDWILPYIENASRAVSLKIDEAISLAKNKNANIFFDVKSQTPFYNYENIMESIKIAHEVWFIDARTIDELIKLTINLHLKGTGVWNIAYFYDQLWLIINTQFKINKLLQEP